MSTPPKACWRSGTSRAARVRTKTAWGSSENILVCPCLLGTSKLFGLMSKTTRGTSTYQIIFVKLFLSPRHTSLLFFCCFRFPSPPPIPCQTFPAPKKHTRRIEAVRSASYPGTPIFEANTGQARRNCGRRLLFVHKDNQVPPVS